MKKPCYFIVLGALLAGCSTSSDYWLVYIPNPPGTNPEFGYAGYQVFGEEDLPKSEGAKQTESVAALKTNSLKGGKPTLVEKDDAHLLVMLTGTREVVCDIQERAIKRPPDRIYPPPLASDRFHGHELNHKN